MPLETGNSIYDLVPSNPPDSDLVMQGDDHLRLIKTVIQQTWPHLTGWNLPTSTGSANAQVITSYYGPTVYLSGQMVTFRAGFTNTGPTTVNVNGVGVVTLAITNTACSGGELQAGFVYTIVYDDVLGVFSIIGGSGAFLPLAGGIMTGVMGVQLGVQDPLFGQLNMLANPATVGNWIEGFTGGWTVGGLRWAMALGDGEPETGGNAGSNFVLQSLDDGGNLLTNPVTVARSTGRMTLVNYSPTSDWNIVLDGATVANGASIGAAVGGQFRWELDLCDGSAESGGNTGSDFVLLSFADNQQDLDAPLIITRSTSVATFSRPIVENSDVRFKTDLGPINDALGKIKKLTGTTYSRVGQDRREIGLIAQEVQSVVPEAVHETPSKEDGPYLGIAYSQLIALLVEAVKTLAAEVEELKTQLGG